jgi:crotonobetainyl-CoA:carnitine CoA-transferase CaiB-like acyl-CoA transferase
MSGALAGIRVLDLGRAIAAPYCALLLAAEGADVIKVEPRDGDPARTTAPIVNGRSMYFATYNQGKRSIAINFRSPGGLSILRDLAAQADVIVQNFRPGTMAAMGLDAEAIWQFNPRLILTSISGFGPTGPLRNRLAIDGVAQAMSGLMHMTGDPAGEPMMTGAFIADVMTATYAALGTAMALVQRERTGVGTEVDATLIDSAVAALGLHTGPVLAGGQGPRRHGNRDSIRAPANVFSTRDGQVLLNASGDNIFVRLAQAMDRPDLLADERFKHWEGRMAHVAELEAEVSAWTSKLSTAELEAICDTFGIPCGPVNDVSTALSLPGLAERGMIRSYDDGDEPLRLLGVPIRISSPVASPLASPLAETALRPPPALGQHSVEILTDVLGYPAEQVDDLVKSGIVDVAATGATALPSR